MTTATKHSARVLGADHVHAAPDGRVLVHVTGSGPAVVTLRSARRLPSRWLADGGRPRIVTLGRRSVTLADDDVTVVAFRLSAKHLALLPARRRGPHRCSERNR